MALRVSVAYLSRMRKSAFEPCIPTKAEQVPARPDWIHEIKHDGYRLIVQRDGNRVRLFTRNGHDSSGRYPLIAEAALRNRTASSFVIDGEAVLLGADRRSDFNGLHSRKYDDEVQFYAFDCLVNNGDDIRKLPLSLRKDNLARLLARRVDGIFVSDFEQPDLFRHACLLDLEGLVSKHGVWARDAAMLTRSTIARSVSANGRCARRFASTARRLSRPRGCGTAAPGYRSKQARALARPRSMPGMARPECQANR